MRLLRLIGGNTGKKPAVNRTKKWVEAWNFRTAKAYSSSCNDYKFSLNSNSGCDFCASTGPFFYWHLQPPNVSVIARTRSCLFHAPQSKTAASWVRFGQQSKRRVSSIASNRALVGILFPLVLDFFGPLDWDGWYSRCSISAQHGA